MGEVHTRATNLKLALTYQDWELIAACTRTVSTGFRKKGMTKQAKEVLLLTLNVDDILAALRAGADV